MADTIDVLNAKVAQIASYAQECAALTGSGDVTVDGQVVVGLGLDAENDMLRSMTRDPQKRNEVTEPLVAALGEYIRTKLNAWGDMQETLIDPEIKVLMKEIDAAALTFDLRLQKAADLFAGGLNKRPGVMPWRAKLGQLLINFIFFDPGMFVTGADLGGSSWGEFLKKSIVQPVITWGIFGIFSEGFTWLEYIAAEVLHLHHGTNCLNDKILSSIKRSLFTKLRESITTQRSALDEAIQNRFDALIEQLSAGLCRILDEGKRHQAQIISKKGEKGDSLDREAARLYALMEALRAQVGSAYRAIYGRDADIDEIDLAAVVSGF